MSKRRRMDFILIAVVLAAALISAAFVYMTHNKGDMAVINVDGNVISELSLSENTTITVEGYQGGSNVVSIIDGKAYVSEADCPDKICVKTGGISRAGEAIVCLPHRVVVEIKSGNGSHNEDFDSIVR